MMTVVWLTSLKNTPKEAKIHDKPRLKITRGRKTKGINIIVQCIKPLNITKAVSKTSRLIAVWNNAATKDMTDNVSKGNITFLHSLYYLILSVVPY